LENGVMDRRVIGERSDAVLRPAMPGDDAEMAEQDNVERTEQGARNKQRDALPSNRLPLSIMTSPSYASVNPNASANSA
jgi:hypothetical protein